MHESDRSSLRFGWWGHELTDGGEDLDDGLVLGVDAPLELAGKRLVRGECLAHAHEGIDTT